VNAVHSNVAVKQLANHGALKSAQSGSDLGWRIVTAQTANFQRIIHSEKRIARGLYPLSRSGFLSAESRRRVEQLRRILDLRRAIEQMRRLPHSPF
jgi:hypothetical protein